VWIASYTSGRVHAGLAALEETMQSETKIAFLELKYCERCGGLWLRRTGTDLVLCAKCCCQVAQPEYGRRRTQ